jgi:hypothetical protein
MEKFIKSVEIAGLTFTVSAVLNEDLSVDYNDAFDSAGSCVNEGDPFDEEPDAQELAQYLQDTEQLPSFDHSGMADEWLTLARAQDTGGGMSSKDAFREAEALYDLHLGVLPAEDQPQVVPEPLPEIKSPWVGWDQ